MLDAQKEQNVLRTLKAKFDDYKEIGETDIKAKTARRKKMKYGDD